MHNQSISNFHATNPTYSPEVDAHADLTTNIPLAERSSGPPVATLTQRNDRARIAPGAAQRSPETRELERNMCAQGLSLEQFKALIPEGGKFVPSASYGKPVASLNDHAGIIVFPAQNRGVSVAEMLAVVKDTVIDEDGVPKDLYFVKGYGNRLVGMQELMQFDHKKYEPALDATNTPTLMETSFRSHLYAASAKATLYARTRVEESDRPVMPVPLNARPFPRMDSWANGEQFLHGFGAKRPKPEAAGTAETAAASAASASTAAKPDSKAAAKAAANAANAAGGTEATAEKPPTSDFHLGYVDYNDTENRLIFFLTGEKNHRDGRATQEREGVTVPASVNPEGPILAQIQGIRSVEAMGPAGQVSGVKLSSLRKPFTSADADKVLRITTEDNAVHELTFTKTGINLKRVLPKPAAEDAMTPLADTDVSLYFYQGRNNGPAGSLEGYANPELILSTGEALQAATLTTDPTSFLSTLEAGGKALAELLTLAPRFGNNPGLTSAVLNTTIKAASTGGAVYGMSAVLNMATTKLGGTLLPGANSFTAAGAGHATPALLAATVAGIVPLQTLLTEAFDFAYKKLPAQVKEKESLTGQAINEFLLPFAGEVSRLVLNYGLEKGVGLPRGNGIDVACLLATAALGAGVKMLRERSGAAENHIIGEKVGIALQFFVGDLVGRALGASASDPHRDGPIKAANYGEAYLARMITRGYDKALAPLLASALNDAGVIGLNAGAYDTQLNRENRYNGMRGALQGLSHDITVAMDEHMAEAGEALRHDIEATATPARAVRLWAHRLHQFTDTLGARAKEVNQQDLHAIQQAIRFPDMSAAKQQAFLNDLSKLTEQRVAASAGETVAAPADGGDAPLPIYNNVDELPPAMKAKVGALMDRFLAAHGPAAGDAERPPYSTRPADEILGPPLPFDAKPSGVLGVKTQRIEQAITTFTREPVGSMKTIHDLLANSKGMPKTPDDSRPEYTRLTPGILRDHWDSEVKYTVQSGPFHYKLRWNDTGQPHFDKVADGVPLQTTRMNQRGNVTGDVDLQVRGRDALLVNLGALHGIPHAGPVMRAVVSEAAYVQAGHQGGRGTVKVGEHVSLTEIFSTTNSSLLAASFLAPQGYNAADSNRRARLVIDNDGHEPVAVQIADETDLKQAETVFMPGTSFIVTKIVADPVKPPAKPGEQPKQNLGQVIHLKRVNIWELEVKHRQLSALKEGGADLTKLVTTDTHGAKVLKSGDLTLRDGEQVVDPVSGNFYKIDLAAPDELEFVSNKNYFLGTELEQKQEELGRTRHPYTSEKSTRGVRDEINEMLLTGDSAVPFLNDMTKNVSYEVDKRKAGYYVEGSPMNAYKKADDAVLGAMQARAARAAAAIQGLQMEQKMPAAKIAAGQPFPGQMLAEIATSALRRPLQVVAVDDSGQVPTEPGADGAPQPLKVADLNKTFDKVDLAWEKDGPAMLGVGKHGYYTMGYREGKWKATPVRISEQGHTPGNLLHAIAASALPNPGGSRYVEKGGVIKTATEDKLKLGLSVLASMPGAYPSAPQFDLSVNEDITGLLGKLKNYAGADYIPMQEWLGQRSAELNGASPGKGAPPPSDASGGKLQPKRAPAGGKSALAGAKPSSSGSTPSGAKSASGSKTLASGASTVRRGLHSALNNHSAGLEVTQAAGILAAYTRQFARPNNATAAELARIQAAETRGRQFTSEFRGDRNTVSAEHEAAMGRNAALARVTLEEAGLTTGQASASGANCLIHSMLDQINVKGQANISVAAEIRTLLTARLQAHGVTLAPGQYLDSFGPHVAHLVDILNERYPQADLAVRIYVPTEDGGLVAVNGSEENGSRATPRSNQAAVMWVGQHYEPIKVA